LSLKKINAEELEVTISSPVTTGRDDTAVSGTALPFNVSGPELVILPTGSAAIRTTVVIITINRHRYLTAASCECKPALSYFRPAYTSTKINSSDAFFVLQRSAICLTA
jgi:hypothetical protein